MNAVEASGSQPPSFCQRHEKTIGYAVLLTGIALTMLTMGVIAALGSVASTEYLQIPADHWRLAGNTPFEHVAIDIVDREISPTIACIPLGIVGGVFSGMVILVGSTIAYRAHRKDPSKEVEVVDPKTVPTERNYQRVRRAIQITAFIVALFSLGMMIGAGILLKTNLPDMQDALQQGRADFPDGGFFWDQVQTKWLEPTSSMMKGLVSLGTIMAVAGGGTLLFFGGWDLIKERLKKFSTAGSNAQVTKEVNV